MNDEHEIISDLEFVPTSYYNTDESSRYMEDGISKTQLNYTIYMFGRMANGKSLTLKIEDYNPSFTIRIPDNWKKNECQAAIAHFKKIYTTTVKRGAKESDIVKVFIKKHHDLYEHFCDGKLFRGITEKMSQQHRCQIEIVITTGGSLGGDRFSFASFL